MAAWSKVLHSLFKSSDGVVRQESGVLENANSDNPSSSVSGSFSYIGPDGSEFSVGYVADRNGFRPQGAHIPSKK
uniref:Uncharacterized protein n=2 Tax=Timema TaxID=61471 RepID=A0A7R9BC91_TIMSH|nr:unnamed protein product [Timema shepardi]